MPNHHPDSIETLFVNGLKARTKERFKIMCVREKISMSEVVVGFIEDVVKGKVGLKGKKR